MHKEISIIVPVFNSAPYLKACIESVRRQTCSDFELFLITDGPTDGSEELCNEFSRQDSRIRLLTQEHRGVSAARNRGLEKAKGDYLFFLDSDDAIHPQLLETLLKLAKKTQAVIATEGFCGLPSKNFGRNVSGLSASKERPFGEKYRYLSNLKALQYLLCDCSQGQLYAVGGKLIRRSALRSVRFDEAISSGEDTKYMYQLMAGGADVVVLCEDGYYYREHPGSRSRERTVDTCKSVYASSKYILFQERAEGRGQYTQKWEESLVRKIAAWHVEAHLRGDDTLIKYTQKLGRKEKACLAARPIRWRTLFEYQLAFHCYPAYEICYRICDLWRRMRRKSAYFHRHLDLWKETGGRSAPW